jgi:hypothetical protein
VHGSFIIGSRHVNQTAIVPPAVIDADQLKTEFARLYLRSSRRRSSAQRNQHDDEKPQERR